MQHIVDGKKNTTHGWSYLRLELCVLGALNFAHKKQRGMGGVQHTTKEKNKLLHVLRALGALDTKNTKDTRGATRNRQKILLHTFGALRAMDFRHKKHRGGGCNTQNTKKGSICAWSFKHSTLFTQKTKSNGGRGATHSKRKKKLCALGVLRTLGALDSGHKKHRRRGGGAQHPIDKKKHYTCLEL